MSRLQLEYNTIDHRWKVLDKGLCIGDGSTQDEAVQSARIVTYRPIYFGNELYSPKEMNWDTREASMIVTNDRRYYDVLEKRIGNELQFMTALYVAIEDYNERNEPAHRIDTAKVNGNEVYIDFCSTCGNETDGWK